MIIYNNKKILKTDSFDKNIIKSFLTILDFCIIVLLIEHNKEV